MSCSSVRASRSSSTAGSDRGAAFGCGKDEGEVVHKEGDAEVRVKDQGDTVDITVKGEDGTATYSSGAGVELPSGFPDDVPTYPGMKLEFSGTQGNMFTVNGRTTDAMAKVRDALKAKAAAGPLSLDQVEEIVRDHIPPAIELARRYQTLQALVNCTRRSLLPDPNVTDEVRQSWHTELRKLEALGLE